MFGEWVCWGVRCVRPRGCCVLFGWSCCACAGLAPRAPLLLFGGRRCARVWGLLFVLRLRVCVWCRHGGCRPAPQLKQSKGAHQLGLMFSVVWGSSVLVDKRHGARREQVGTTPAQPTSFFFLLSLPARQHLPGSGVYVSRPRVFCVWGCGLWYQRWWVAKGGGVLYGVSCGCVLFGFHFLRGYLCECAVGA